MHVRKHFHSAFETALDIIGVVAMIAAFIVPWTTIEKILLFAVGFMLFILVWA